MAESSEKFQPCSGAEKDNFRRAADRRTREAKLQDRLAEWLLRMEPGNMDCAGLDSLLHELDRVAPLPDDKRFTTEDDLAQLYRKYRAAQHAASGRPAARAVHDCRAPMHMPSLSHINERQTAKLICGGACLAAAIKYVQWYRWI